jgi:hypothetical protein
MTKGIWSRSLRRLGLTLLFSLTVAASCLAQISAGSIVGTVRDSSGALVPNATITVTNKATGVSVTTTTNGAGEYQVLALNPGTYSAKASASGFASQVRNDIEIHVQSRPSIDFTLKVGQVSQVVEVTAATPLLQTQTADVGGVVGARQIVDLPLNGRRYADLALLEPGVQKYYSANNPAPDRFSSNGNLELQNDFLLDGIGNNSGSTNLQEFSVQVVQPPPDALQEFKVQTRTYSAEFGASAGAVVNASVKSGTNQFHGNLWEFVRNNKFDANTFFNNANGTPIGHFSQNQFGGTIGGPIRKDKTFFFFDLQKFTSRQATTVNSTVPTPLMKHGNFTELGQPLTDSPVAGQAGCVSGNVVQAGCIDPVAAKLIALFPDPNIPSAVAAEGTPGGWTGGSNYQFQASVPDDVYSLDGRVDHALNATNRIFGRYSYYHVNRQDPPWTSDPVAGNGNFATQYRIRGQQAALSWSDTLSNSLLNELRLGFSRDFAHSDPVGLSLGKSLASQFGLNGIPEGPNSAGIPPINIFGLVRLGSSPWRPQFQISQAWQILESLNWLKGNHSFKFGYQYLKTTDTFLDIRSPQGEISSNGIYTADSSFGVPDFLLGDVDAIRFTTPLVVHNYVPGHSWYAQDTWRLKPNLTVNYGLRYDLFAPVLNHQNQVSNFTPANGGGIVAVAPGASGWFARSLIHPDRNNFAPRVGFSYHPLERLVIRGGYGVFYQPFNRIGSESVEELNPPWLIDASLSQTQGTNTPVMFLQTGFPAGEFTPALVDLTSLQVRAQDPNQRTSYVEQVSFGPEFQISRNMALDLTYVGNWGRKMNRLRNANQGVVSGFDATGSPIVSFPFANLNTETTAVSGAGQHAFLEYATNDGNTDYHALEVSFRRTFAGGVGFGLNYTWSHNLADFVDNLTGAAFPQNAYNYGAEMSNSILDIQHRFVGNVIWDLPFGEGRPLFNNHGLASRWLGGWQFNSIVTLQTGSPFDVTAPDQTSTGPSHSSYPDCIGNAFAGATDDPHQYITGGGGFFINPAAFAVPATGRFGNCPPRAFHGPGIGNVDLSLFKQFRLTETKRVEFRAEFFNAFNHPNFANPNASFSPSSVGSFGRVFNTIQPILGQSSGGPGDPREIQLALKVYF